MLPSTHLRIFSGGKLIYYSVLSASKTRPLLLNSSVYTGRIQFFYDSFSEYSNEYYIQLTQINTIKILKKKFPKFLKDHKISSCREERIKAKFECVKKFPNSKESSCNYGNLPWKTGADYGFIHFATIFRGIGGSSKLLWNLNPQLQFFLCRDSRELATLKRWGNLTGLRLNFLFSNFPEEAGILLGPAALTVGTLTGTYSTRPFSTMLEILTTMRDPESSEDGLTPSTAYHYSCESLTTILQSTARLKRAETPATIWEPDGAITWLQDSYTALVVKLLEVAADSVNIATPESEKKFLWVNCGLLTKTFTLSRAPRISSWGTITRSRLITNFSPEVTDPQTMGAVSYNNCNKDNSVMTSTIKFLYLICHDTYFEQMLASRETNLLRAKRKYFSYIRAASRRRPLQLSLMLNKSLVINRTSFNLAPSNPPPLQKPIKQQGKEMEWRVVVSTNDNCRAERTYSVAVVASGRDDVKHGLNVFSNDDWSDWKSITIFQLATE